MFSLDHKQLVTLRRSSISDQAAGVLREAILNGELVDPLPGEHRLSERLGVSRPSVRAAMAQLAAEGLVITKRGRRSRLVPRVLSPSASPHRVACIVCPVTLQNLHFDRRTLLLEMQIQFAKFGVNWEQVFDAKLGSHDPAPGLERLVAGQRHTCWILLAATPAMQLWFSRARLPALVLGSVGADIGLPSVDHDYQAIGRHAAAEMLRHGHHHASLVMPSELLPGDRACRDAFRRCFEETNQPVSIVECVAANDPIQFRRRLTRMLGNTVRPTAIMSMRTYATLTLVVHIMALGLRIPQDVSVVLRDSHPLFELGLPEFTRYVNSDVKLAKRAVRLAVTLLSGRKIPATSTLLTPTLVRGMTLSNLG